MALKKLWAIPKDGYLLLLDCDYEENDINFLEEAHSEVKSPTFDKDENMSPYKEVDEDMEDEVDLMLDKSGENVNFSVEWQRFARSVETPMENRNLLSGEQQDGNASKLDLMEVQNPVTHDDENEIPKVIVGDTRYLGPGVTKREHMETYIKDSFKGSNQKLEQLWQINKREREMIKKSCEQYKTTFQEFDMDVLKFNEEQEKSVNNYQKEEQALKLSKCSQSHTLEAIKDMHEMYIKGLMNLETNNYDMLLDVDGELRK